MIIYNKYMNNHKYLNIPIKTINPKTLPLTDKSKQFLKSIKLRLKEND